MPQFLPGPGPLFPFQVGEPESQVVAAVVTPSLAVVVENARPRPLPETPVVAHGFVDSGVGVPGTTPPPAQVLDRSDQRARYLPQPTQFANGLLSTVAPPTVTPPAPVVVDRVDQRHRYRAPDPVSQNGLYAATPPPTVAPPPPTVAPLEEHVRHTAAESIATQFRFAAPDVPPVIPVVIDRVDQRVRYTAPDPIVLNGLRAAVFVAPPVLPPSPEIVEYDERLRRARRQQLDPTVFNQALLVFVAPPQGFPPRAVVVEREDIRRFKTADSIFTRFRFDSVVTVVSPPATGANQDFASIVTGW